MRNMMRKRSMRRRWVLIGVPVMLVGALLLQPLTPAAKAAGFTDIRGHWAEKTILESMDKGIVDGFPDGTFRPDDVVTGDQFVAMMFRAHAEWYTTEGERKRRWDQKWLEGLQKRQPGIWMDVLRTTRELKFAFEPAKTGYWAQPFLDFLYNDSIVLPSFDNVFPKKPEVFQQPITREKASYLLGSWFRMLESDGDNSLNIGRYRDYVLANSGLLDLNDFSPEAGMYKAEVLVFGLMRGWDNRFWPKRYVTRAEALTMALRLRYPELREPFRPIPVGVPYDICDGSILVYDSQEKFDWAKKMERTFDDLARQHVKTGYVVGGCGGVAVWNSKEEAEQSDFYTRLAKWDMVKHAEFSALVSGPDSPRIITLRYPIDHRLVHSQALFDAVLNVLSDGKGPDLKTKLEVLERQYETDIQKGYRYTLDRLYGKKVELSKAVGLVSVNFWYDP